MTCMTAGFATALTMKSIKLMHAAHAMDTLVIEQHIAPGYEAVLMPIYIEIVCNLISTSRKPIVLGML
jgi:hypothetical protein